MYIKYVIIVCFLGIQNYVFSSSVSDIAYQDELLKEVMKRDVEDGSGFPSGFFNTKTVSSFCQSTESKTCKGYNGDDCVCSCNIGFYQHSENNCIKIKSFKGLLVYYKNNLTLVEKKASKYLKKTFTKLEGFQEVSVLPTNVQTELSFDLIFDMRTNLTNLEFLNQFQTLCRNQSTFEDLQIDCKESLSQSLNSLNECGVIFENFCDRQTTSCHVSNGEAYCLCKKNFYNSKPHFTSCQEQICSSSRDCNWPFGGCDKINEFNISKCTCFWGFTGNHCHQATTFILAAVLSFVIFCIILFLLCSCCCKRKVKREKYESRDNIGSFGENQMSETPFSFPNGLQLRAKVPQHNRVCFPTSETSTVACDPPSSVKDDVMSNPYSYTNKSYIGNVRQARIQIDLNRVDYF